MAVVSSKQRFDFACKTTIEQLKKYSKNVLQCTYVFLAKWEKNTVNKIEENEPEKLAETKLAIKAKLRTCELYIRYRSHKTTN